MSVKKKGGSIILWPRGKATIECLKLNCFHKSVDIHIQINS